MNKTITITAAFLLSVATMHAGQLPSRDTTGIQQKKDTIAADTTDILKEKKIADFKAETSQAPHLYFKGIPIEGTAMHFADALKKEGFVTSGSGMYGTFAGYPARLAFRTTPLSGQIWAVSVYLSGVPTFSMAKKQYDLFKYNITAIYGKPQSSTEKFHAPYTAKDGMNDKALAEGKAQFETIWAAETGTIRCRIIYDSQTDNKSLLLPIVTIDYIDETGADINDKEQEIKFRRDL